ncbi:SDR family NAD(P)-dependent oxidoreductase [Streptomyces sp. NPDC006372]|uniref:SDR family NAD(P)-dependent oxidoreductase n=1 Tax=Streptomyces sp. NPDC006372 TaxID=3155599 RepID=UPI0033AC89F9
MQTRNALVTGANRGLGAAIADGLAAQGIRVWRGVRDGVLTAHDVRLDVRDAESVTAAVRHVLDADGRVDILVNNAGVTDGRQAPATADLEVAARVWDTNVLGAWRCAQAVLPAMREAGWGRIVNVSSTLGSLHLMDRPSEPAYRVSKAALNALTRVLAAELTGTGVLVNAASPGWVRTGMSPSATRGPAEGADTPVWLATLPDDGPTGGFFRDREPLAW